MDVVVEGPVVGGWLLLPYDAWVLVGAPSGRGRFLARLLTFAKWIQGCARLPLHKLLQGPGRCPERRWGAGVGRQWVPRQRGQHRRSYHEAPFRGDGENRRPCADECFRAS